MNKFRVFRDCTNIDFSSQIQESTNSVNIEVPFGTDTKSLVPMISFIGASISPEVDVPQDFSVPVIYTILAEDGTSATYSVYVKTLANPAKEILCFSFANPDIVGVVDRTKRTISLLVPEGVDVSNLVPNIEFTGASIEPAAKVATDFSHPVTYHVTAMDGTVSDYIATVTVVKTVPNSLKILILGNSITHHTPSSDIGWFGDWGMAASSIEHDFVHVLISKLRNSFPLTAIDYKEQNIADWERDFTYSLSNYSAIEDYSPDILIIRLGENVQEDNALNGNYYVELNKLINFYKITSTKVIITGNFWPNVYKDYIQSLVALKGGYSFLDFSDINSNPENTAYGLFWHSGVASHPSDKGMGIIAIRIYREICNLFLTD